MPGLGEAEPFETADVNGAPDRVLFQRARQWRLKGAGNEDLSGIPPSKIFIKKLS